MLGLLFLLLPVAAAYGWYMGQRSVRQSQDELPSGLSSQYVTGLNYLLSDQQDKAVDLFIDLLKVNTETIETHMALGNLFRRRGEVDRAIRVHQNLIARPQLPAEQKQQALFELGQDYIQAGLYDRAETLYVELIKNQPRKSPPHAVRQLLVIYQHTREWDKAVALTGKVDLRQESELSHTLGHCYCELAEQCHGDGDIPAAVSHYRKALSVDKSCVRANLQLSQLYQQQNNRKEALAALRSALDQDVDFASECLKLLQELCQDEPAQLMSILHQSIDKGAGASVTTAYSDLLYSRDGREPAERYLLQQLQSRPTIRGFKRLIEYHIEDVPQGAGQNALINLRDMLQSQIRIRPVYRCRHCGFNSRSLYWQCPSCKQWGLVKPIRDIDGE